MRKALREFAECCEIVLQDNDYKGGWNEDDQKFLLGKLMEEVGEVGNLLKDLTYDCKDLYRECCDVANIAMMIADNFGSKDAQGLSQYTKEEKKSREEYFKKEYYKKMGWKYEEPKRNA